MPKTNYNNVSFWEQKYKVTCCESYEWICKPENIFTEISAHLNYQQMSKVLQIGMGSSSLMPKLKVEIDARNQSAQFTCIDFSKQLIKKCKNGKLGLSNANYICTDIRQMNKSLDSQQFDYIFDKGCLDCIFCQDNFIKEVLKALRQCYKCLKQCGKLIIISHGKPKNRVYLMRNKLVPFSVQFQMLPKTKNRQTQVYAYICTKSSLLSERNANQQHEQDGKIISQHQKSQDEQQQKNKKQQQKKKQKKKETKKQNKKQSVKQPVFILEEKGKKKQKIKQQPQAQFILEQVGSNSKNKKKQAQKQKKGSGQDEVQFILDQQQDQNGEQKDQQENNENQQNQQNEQNLQQQDQQKQNNEQQGNNQQQQNQQNDQENINQEQNVQQKQRKGKQKQKQEQASFILKQAQYEDSFDYV